MLSKRCIFFPWTYVLSTLMEIILTIYFLYFIYSIFIISYKFIPSSNKVASNRKLEFMSYLCFVYSKILIEIYWSLAKKTNLVVPLSLYLFHFHLQSNDTLSNLQSIIDDNLVPVSFFFSSNIKYWCLSRVICF